MNVSLQDLVPDVRYLIDDNLSSSGHDIFTYNTSNIFTISEPNTQTVSSVTVNGTDSGVTYTYNPDTLKVTVTSSLTMGDVVEIYYTYYCNYSDAEIKYQIQGAIVILVVRSIFEYSVIGNFIRPEPSFKERKLISLIASILIDPKNISYRLPDVVINVPKDSLTTEDKISQILCKYKKDSNGIFTILGGVNERDQINRIGG